MKSSLARKVLINHSYVQFFLSNLLIGLLAWSNHCTASGCVSALIKDDCSAVPLTFLLYVSSLLAYSPCLYMALITMDRFICIVESLRYFTNMSETKANQAIIIYWVISAVFPVIRLIPSFPMTNVVQIILSCDHIKAEKCLERTCFVETCFC